MSTLRLYYADPYLTECSARVVSRKTVSDRPAVELDQLGLDAGAILRTAIHPLGGRGGGRDDLAQGSVPDPSMLPNVLDAVVDDIRRSVANPEQDDG